MLYDFFFYLFVGQGSDCPFTEANPMALPLIELLKFHIPKLSDMMSALCEGFGY